MVRGLRLWGMHDAFRTFVIIDVRLFLHPICKISTLHPASF
jgi:hypothetical protein